MFGSLFQWVGRFIGGAIEALAGWVLGWWNAAVAVIVPWIQEAAATLGDMLPPQVQTLVQSPLVSGNIATFVSALTYFVPVKGILVLLIAGWGICAIIRLVRWIKSFIPTMSGA